VSSLRMTREPSRPKGGFFGALYVIGRRERV
jgi:hypothetical protein